MWDQPGHGSVDIELVQTKSAVTRAELQVALASCSSPDPEVAKAAEEKVKMLCGTVINPDVLLRGLSQDGSRSIRSFVIPVQPCFLPLASHPFCVLEGDRIQLYGTSTTTTIMYNRDKLGSQTSCVAWAAVQKFDTDGSPEAEARAQSEAISPFQGKDSLFHVLSRLFSKLRQGGKDCTFSCSKLVEGAASEEKTSDGLL